MKYSHLMTICPVISSRKCYPLKNREQSQDYQVSRGAFRKFAG